jgi:hypothetical protein
MARRAWFERRLRKPRVAPAGYCIVVLVYAEGRDRGLVCAVRDGFSAKRVAGAIGMDRLGLILRVGRWEWRQSPAWRCRGCVGHCLYVLRSCPLGRVEQGLSCFLSLSEEMEARKTVQVEGLPSADVMVTRTGPAFKVYTVQSVSFLDTV